MSVPLSLGRCTYFFALLSSAFHFVFSSSSPLALARVRLLVLSSTMMAVTGAIRKLGFSAETRASGPSATTRARPRAGIPLWGIARVTATPQMAPAKEPISRSMPALSDPPTLHELSPYEHVNAPHVNGYFRTLDARFTNLALEVRKAGYDPTLFGYTDTSPDPRRYTPDDPALKTYEGVLPGMTVGLQLPDHMAAWEGGCRLIAKNATFIGSLALKRRLLCARCSQAR